MKLKNLILALKDQGPFKRAFRNFFITGNAWGLFHINSHIRQDTQNPKVMYNTQETAAKSAISLGKKNGVHFSYYKCAYCDGYHIGKNRDNKCELCSTCIHKGKSDCETCKKGSNYEHPNE